MESSLLLPHYVVYSSYFAHRSLIIGASVFPETSIHADMMSQVLTAVKMSMSIFWVVTLEDRGSMFFRNVGIYLQVHAALQPRRKTSTLPSKLHQAIEFVICLCKRNLREISLAYRPVCWLISYFRPAWFRAGATRGTCYHPAGSPIILVFVTTSVVSIETVEQKKWKRTPTHSRDEWRRKHLITRSVVTGEGVQRG
jgi:hypothetical protein